LDLNGENMIYKVKATVIEETIGEFYRKLADGTVSEQRPDGEEIVASMKRAVLTAPGVAEWYEMFGGFVAKYMSDCAGVFRVATG
jgi:hypothetical protein